MSITLQNTPPQRSIQFDANHPVFTAVSTNGQGYYYRVRVREDGTVIREQGWSRLPEDTATIDLSHIFKHRFDFPFVPATGNDVVFAQELTKFASIDVQEFDLATDTLVETAAVQTYLLHKSINRHLYEQAQVIGQRSYFLGAPPEGTKVHDKSIVQIPFIVGSKILDGFVTVTIESTSGTIYDQNFPVNDRGSFYLRLDMSTLNIQEDTSLVVNIQVGQRLLSRKLSVIKYHKYPIHTIAFQNNYGHWIYADLFGRRTDDNDYEIEKYKIQDDTYQRAQIIQTKEITINTGYLSVSQFPIIEMICNSLETHIYIDGRFQLAELTQRGSVGLTDNETLFNQDLSFELKHSQL